MNITPEAIEIILQIFQTIAVLIGVVVAVIGIKAWKKEMVGRRKAELAEEVLASFYEAKEVIEWVRFPGGYAGEGETRTPTTAETEEQAQARNFHYVPVERLNKNNELFSKIQAQKYRFMAYFGKESEKPFKDMKSIHNQIIVAAGTLIRTEHHLYTTGGIPQSVVTLREKSENIIGRFLDEDPIEPIMNEVMEKIEAICRPCLLDRKA